MIKTGNSKTGQQVSALFFHFNFFGPIHNRCKVQVSEFFKSCSRNHKKSSDIRIQESGESLHRLVPNKLLLRESKIDNQKKFSKPTDTTNWIISITVIN